VIVASTGQGIFRRASDGQWTKLSGKKGTGVPAGGSFALASDPHNPGRLFADVGIEGIFRSDDTGTTWSKVSDAAIDKLFKPSRPSMVRIAVGNANNLYVAIARIVRDSDNPDRTARPRLAGLFRSGDGGATWTALDLPGSVEEGDKTFGVHPGGQATLHFSLAADPGDANIVYVGGDRQPAFNEDSNGSRFPNSVGAGTWSARLFRVDASKESGSQAAPLTDSGTASGSTVHPDSRGMVIATNGDLFEVNDGGIYRRTNPQTEDGDWFSMNGDIQITEFHSVAWDSVAHVIIGGAQDNNTSQQGEEKEKEWGSVDSGDGGVVAVDDTSTPGESIRYSSTQYLGSGWGAYDGGFRTSAKQTLSAKLSCVR
jgi:hypothetical protein